MPSPLKRKYVTYAPSISSGPCATLITRMTPKIKANPSATIAYNAPDSSPEITTCPTITGVIITFTGGIPLSTARRSPTRFHFRGHAQPAKFHFRGRALPARSKSWGRPGRGPSRPPPNLTLVPGRRGEARLGLGQVVGPDGHLLLALPLERHHLVGGLKPVLVDLVIAEERLGLELEELLTHLVGVERARPLHRLGVDGAARVAGG